MFFSSSHKRWIQFNNKKGVVLAFVIIIGAALFILVGTAALLTGSNIRLTDDATKTRQAYLNVKSGIEFAKVLIDEKVEDTTDLLNTSPGAIETLPATETLYASGYPDSGFTVGEDPDAPIQIICEVLNEKIEVESTTPDVIEYGYNMVINVTAESDLKLNGSDPSMPESIKLKYDIEPLKGSIIIGDGTIEGGEVIPEGTVFDANISGDLKTYINNNRMLVYQFRYNNDDEHSIVITETVDKLDFPNTVTLGANKMYFLGSPGFNIKFDENSKAISLKANYIYFKEDLKFELSGKGNNSQVFYIGGNTVTQSIVYVSKDIKVDIVNPSKGTTDSLSIPKGIYAFGSNTSTNYLFKYNKGNVSFPALGDMEVPVSSVPGYLAKFDTYIADKPGSNLTLHVSSGVNLGWTDNNISMYNRFKEPDEQKEDDLVLVFAKYVYSNKNYSYTGKQIRFVASSKNDPVANDDDFEVADNTDITFNTSLLSYYGDEITKGNKYSSLILNALNDGDIAAIYLPIPTNIGENNFYSGYYILPSGTDLAGNNYLTNAEDNSGNNLLYDTPVISIDGGSDNIFYSYKLLGYPGHYSKNVSCVNIDTGSITFGGLIWADPYLTFESLPGQPIYFYFAQDTVIQQKDKVSNIEIKAGFYKYQGSGGTSIIDLTDDPDLTRISSIFAFPGLEEGQGSSESTFTPTPASMGGIYR